MTIKDMKEIYFGKYDKAEVWTTAQSSVGIQVEDYEDYEEAFDTQLVGEKEYNLITGKQVDFAEYIGKKNGKILIIKMPSMVEPWVNKRDLLENAKRKFGDGVIYETVNQLIKESEKIEFRRPANYGERCAYCGEKVPDGEFYKVDDKLYCKECLENMTYSELESTFNFGKDEIIKFFLNATLCEK